jgi:hypothetical protein
MEIQGVSRSRPTPFLLCVRMLPAALMDGHRIPLRIISATQTHLGGCCSFRVRGTFWGFGFLPCFLCVKVVGHDPVLNYSDANSWMEQTIETSCEASGEGRQWLCGMGKFTFEVSDGMADSNMATVSVQVVQSSDVVFVVTAEGLQVCTGLDLLTQVGMYEAHNYPIGVTVEDGELNLEFTSKVNWAKLSTILIEGLQSSRAEVHWVLAGELLIVHLAAETADAIRSCLKLFRDSLPLDDQPECADGRTLRERFASGAFGWKRETSHIFSHMTS